MKYVKLFWAVEHLFEVFGLINYPGAVIALRNSLCINQNCNHSFFYYFRLFNIISFQILPTMISKHPGISSELANTEFPPLQNSNTLYITSSWTKRWRNSHDVDAWCPHGPQCSWEGRHHASKHQPAHSLPAVLTARHTPILRARCFWKCSEPSLYHQSMT